ncbi:phosphoribosyltransferase family protein [Sulfodiicoccus acidiphilus]|uniref:phosphoribosyltransferase family protein n=1 Tax=Sulfodiicoccus acidiphilus TaxID=1670455 RepID=UPI00227D9855|nr:phosphoribosyltransferase family protein [Sulfodiicoccus acidiphilus]
MRMRIMAVETLKELKKTFTYKELSSMLDIQESLLCRYTNGATIPSELQAREILGKVKTDDFIFKFFKDKISIYDDNFVDTSKILFYPNLLTIVVLSTLEKASAIDEVDKVITPAVNGIALGAMAAYILRRPLIVVKKYKESTYVDYYEESVREVNSMVSTFYLRKDLIEKGDRVLVVDDVVRSGKTVRALVSLVNRSGASVVGVLALIGVGRGWQDGLRDVKNVKVILRL